MRAVRRRSEAGFALIVVLWGLALIAAIGVAVASTARTEALLARNAVENARARHAAEAGFNHAIGQLVTAPGAVVPPSAPPYELMVGTLRVAVEVRDEGGRVDLNEATPEMIHGLLRAIGSTAPEADRLAAAILDWRDGDDVSVTGTGETAAYREAGLAYGPRSAPFETVAELRHVLGMSDAVFRRLAPEVTVHSGHRGVDPYVATRTVLMAIPGVTELQVDTWLRQRANAGGRIDGLFGLADARRYLSISASRSFAITAEAVTAGGARHRVEGVVLLTDRADRPYILLAWRG